MAAHSAESVVSRETELSGLSIMCSTFSFRTAGVTSTGNTSKEDRPHTAEELRKMKEELEEMKAYHKWCELQLAVADKQANAEETQLVIQIRNKLLDPEDRPHTAKELRKMKEELEEMKAYHKWCELQLTVAEKQAKAEEEQLLTKILKAQEKIRKDIDHKRAQKLAAAAMEDEAWVFEKSANGWI